MKPHTMGVPKENKAEAGAATVLVTVAAEVEVTGAVVAAPAIHAAARTNTRT